MIDVAKARDGENGNKNSSSIFFCCSCFIRAALAMLSLAHGQYSQTDTYCAWYHATYNFPKGCNSACKDSSDTTVIYAGDGYSNCGKTGSGVAFAKTTHNGQASGVADLNGLVKDISIGVTCIAADKSITGATQANPCVVTVASHGYSIGDVVAITSVGGMTQLNNKLYKITVVDTNSFSLDGVGSTGYGAYTSGGTYTKGTFYVAKSTVSMKDFTSGATTSTDHWGATGVANMMDALSATTVASMFKVTGGGGYSQKYGSGTYQVLDESTSGESWIKTCIGLVKSENSIDSTGTQLFGQDSYYQCITNNLCITSGSSYLSGSSSGIWATELNLGHTTSSSGIGGRFACYPL